MVHTKDEEATVRQLSNKHLPGTTASAQAEYPNFSVLLVKITYPIVLADKFMNEFLNSMTVDLQWFCHKVNNKFVGCTISIRQLSFHLHFTN